MSTFTLLRDPEAYRALDWDLTADESDREQWLDLFEKVFEQITVHARKQYGRVAERQITEASEEFAEALEQIRRDPSSLPAGRLDLMELDKLRDGILRRHHLDDPFKDVKQAANARASEQYLDVARRFHELDVLERWEHLVRGVFAGNLYDLGSEATLDLADTPPDFVASVENVKPRPWLVDDFDALAGDVEGAPPMKWAKAVLFVDNAGSDFVLGVMPLARELVLAGTEVVLAANELASLNDMTADETVEVVERLAALDRDLKAMIDAQMVEVVSTGGTMPVLDLSDVSEELNAAAQGADLVLLEGMGRCVETNWNAQFTVDRLDLAMLKNALVAERIGGELYDCICRYGPVETPDADDATADSGGR
ncbi:MAG: ARMT1-like domain-containing protein [Planctomycetota bacterium]